MTIVSSSIFTSVPLSIENLQSLLDGSAASDHLAAGREDRRILDPELDSALEVMVGECLGEAAESSAGDAGKGSSGRPAASIRRQA